MAKADTGSVNYCSSCEWRQRLILKMSFVVDKLGHELEGTDIKYRQASPEVRQLINGRKYQHEALLRELNKLLDEEEFDIIDDGEPGH